MVNRRPVRRGGPKQSTDVRYSDRGFAYAELSQTGEIIGLVPSYLPEERPSLKDSPKGIIIHNRLTECLEISDPDNDRWISFCSSGCGCPVGEPTDGSFDDGALPIDPSGTVADAVDLINEYLVSSMFFDYASHLGTMDGKTNGFLVEPSFAIGRVASPSSYGNPYYTDSWDTDTNRDITNQSSLVWQLVNNQRITDVQSGTISLNYYNGNNDLIHTELLVLDGTLNNQQSNPDSHIQVSNIIQLGNRKEGFLRIDVPVGSLITNGGYLRGLITHTINLVSYSHPILEFFLDPAPSPSIVTQGVSLEVTPEKYLSGVKFATISGSSRPQLRLRASVSGVWKDTYRADPVLVQTSQLGITDYVIPYNSSSVTKQGITPPISPFKYNEDFVYNEVKEIIGINILNPDSSGAYKQVRYIVRDPFNSVNGSYFTPIPQVLINTYPPASTDLLELFTDEEYRLESSSIGTKDMIDIHGTGRGIDAWDSPTSLISRSGLQVINGALVYPQLDFSAFAPVPNPNYIPLAAGPSDLVYIRRFKDTSGTARTNGILDIEGLLELDRSNKNILIDIRVVGDHILGNGTQGAGNEGTGWLSLNIPFNIATFLGDTGDGCFVTTQSLTAPYFEFTLGGFSTAYAANNAIEIRITYKYPSGLTKRITKVEITDWI